MPDYGPPEISILDPGDDVKAYYRSSRSGNEVSRKGTVAFITVVDETEFTWVRTDNPEPLKHQYIILYETETDDGEPVVLVTSATVSAEEPNDGDPVKPGEHYAIQFSIARKSHLGVCFRVMKDGVNINVEL
jgi:hypothetical protein